MNPPPLARTITHTSYSCPGCGRPILAGEFVYLARHKPSKRTYRHVCAACAWRRMMKNWPKHDADGRPAPWARPRLELVRREPA
jgi:DNA-directed RNA polymerase subunit RPC12/RpoP